MRLRSPENLQNAPRRTRKSPAMLLYSWAWRGSGSGDSAGGQKLRLPVGQG